MAKKDNEQMDSEAQGAGMPSEGGPMFSCTDDITPPTPSIVKTSKPSTGPVKR